MTEVVLDASVILKWFRAKDEIHAEPARELRTLLEGGSLTVFAPHLLYLEVLNVAGRRWRWAKAELVQLVHALERLPFDLREPALASVAQWTGRGLTAYDATYVALAEGQGIPLITEDALILSIASGIARPLSHP